MIRFVFIGICLINNAGSVASAGSFWQISDLHLEQNYSIHGDIRDMCRGNNPNVTLSPYGNFNCDSPWKLVTNAILAMKHLEAAPDFILWTGDIMAHVSDNVVSWSDIFSALNQTTNLLIDTFPNTKVISVIGNHDVHPANEVPEIFYDIYKQYLTEGGWNKFVPENQINSFTKGGYYAVDINPKLKIIVLNTNIYLSHNKVRPKDRDPASQLGWLKEQLQYSKNNNIKVIITAHAPPGYFERNPAGPFLASPYSEELIALYIMYSDVIITQIYGHTHTDSFRLFIDPADVVRTHAFISPSVSPMKLTGMSGINPSIRLYDYNLTTGIIKNYQQYFLNLTQVSLDDQTSTHDIELSNDDVTVAKQPMWELLYDANLLYGVHNLDIKSLYIMYEDISSNDEIFEKYYLYNSAGVKDKPCDAKCRRIHICAITHLTEKSMEDCMKLGGGGSGGGGSRHHHHEPITPRMKYVIIGIAIGLFVALVVMAVIASAFCVRRRFTSGFRYQKQVSYNTT